jgi:DNA polymerase-3 subunit delta
MALIKIQEFDKILSSKKISPVYLFAGDEYYFIDSCLSKIEKISPTDNLNKEIFYGGESAVRDIADALHTAPFLSEKKTVIVKNAHKATSKNNGESIAPSVPVVKNARKTVSKNNNKNYVEALSYYTENPIDTSILILLYCEKVSEEKLPKEFADLKNCIAVDCNKVYEKRLPEFIKNKFQQKGKIVVPSVISRLIEENGNDLLNISNEIEKICLFVGSDKKNISQDDLENISGYTKELTQYALPSAIEEKNLQQALFVFEKLLSYGQAPAVLLWQISSAVRKLLTAKSMIEEQGMSAQETASAIRIHHYFADPFFRNLKKHNADKLKKSFKIMLKTDSAAKGVGDGADAVSAIEKLLLFICK